MTPIPVPKAVETMPAVGRRWPYPRVLAHRGGGTLAPENTLAAIDFGYRAGFRAVEFDAVLAADEVAVLLHDPTLDRTTSGRGPVNALTAAELGKLDAGRWHGPAFAGVPVPTLAQAIARCVSLGVWMNIEIKPYPGLETRTGAAVAIETAQAFPGGAADPQTPLLSSFSIAALEAARATAPQLPRAWLVDAFPADFAQRLEALACVSLNCNQRRLDAAQAAAVKRAGYWLFCYTVNDVARARELLSWGVDAFCTDRLDLISPNLSS